MDNMDWELAAMYNTKPRVMVCQEARQLLIVFKDVFTNFEQTFFSCVYYAVCTVQIHNVLRL